MPMPTEKLLALARKHLGGDMESSARLCLSDAVALFDQGDLKAARRRALASLRYSIGILHPDYARASAQ